MAHYFFPISPRTTLPQPASQTPSSRSSSPPQSQLPRKDACSLPPPSQSSPEQCVPESGGDSRPQPAKPKNFIQAWGDSRRMTQRGYYNDPTNKLTPGEREALRGDGVVRNIINPISGLNPFF